MCRFSSCQPLVQSPFLLSLSCCLRLCLPLGKRLLILFFSDRRRCYDDLLLCITEHSELVLRPACFPQDKFRWHACLMGKRHAAPHLLVLHADLLSRRLQQLTRHNGHVEVALLVSAEIEGQELLLLPVESPPGTATCSEAGHRHRHLEELDVGLIIVGCRL